VVVLIQDTRNRDTEAASNTLPDLEERDVRSLDRLAEEARGNEQALRNL
jgi:hypothetical protein